MQNLRPIREAAGLTQTELAARSGVPQHHISDLETGRIKYPQLPVGVRLAAALDVDELRLLDTADLQALADDLGDLLSRPQFSTLEAATYPTSEAAA